MSCSATRHGGFLTGALDLANGEIATALTANADRLLAQPPELGMADVLAAEL